MQMREDDVSVGALRLPPDSIVAFRADAIYTADDADWPYHGNPGDFLLKGRLPFLGGAHLAEQQQAARWPPQAHHAPPPRRRGGQPPQNEAARLTQELLNAGYTKKQAAPPNSTSPPEPPGCAR